MRKFILTIFSIFTILAAAGADVSPLARLLVGTQFANQTRHNVHALASGDDGEQQEFSPTHYPLLLQISGESVLTQLDELGVIIYGRRGDILAVAIPMEALQIVFELDGVVYASESGTLNSCLDKAIPVGNVDKVHAGIYGLEGFDGNGVVVGFCDIGFDPHHAAFEGRVKRLHSFKEFFGERVDLLTEAEINCWITDDSTNYHATHVAGILTGAARLNGYDGVARGADIVATTSQITDVGIIAGIESIIGYAKSVGQPAVINISMSNHLGPHDGTDLFDIYLSRCAKEATICISAGNSGTRIISANHDFTAAAPETKVLLNTLRTWDGFDIQGYTDIWSDDSTPFEVCIGVYDQATASVVYRSAPATPADPIIKITEDDAEWAKYMQGKVIGYGELSPLNNRYNFTLQYDYTTEGFAPGKKYARYSAVILAKGAEGHHLDMYTDGEYSYFVRPAGSKTNINSDGSINNMCTAEGVVCVGAMSSRNSAPLLNGSVQTWNFSEGNVAAFSSYSNLPTVKPLPHFCAPGNYVVSAGSAPFLKKCPEVFPVAAQATDNGKTYSWFADCGTSMSAPYAAGVFALWLQADPTLTPIELRDLAQMTARRDFADIDNIKWGAGAIDALAGLREILNIQSGIYDVSILDVSQYRLHDMRGLPCPIPAEFDPLNPSASLQGLLTPGVYILSHPSRKSLKICL